MDIQLLPLLERIACALEKLSPPTPTISHLDEANAFIWSATEGRLIPVKEVAFIDLTLLKGIEAQKDTLYENTLHFAKGLPANNAMLWGTRGMGKSSLVKSIHQKVLEEIGKSNEKRLILLEIPRDDLGSLPILLNLLKPLPHRFIVFCDDLSFEKEDKDYKALKSVLDGGIAGRPENVLFYATSNRRHLMPRDMIENESSTAINPSEAIEEKVSLSDRFGLWIGFHHCTPAIYEEMVKNYAKYRNLPIEEDQLLAEANAWSIMRGSRSGRVAWQFIEDLTARLK